MLERMTHTLDVQNCCCSTCQSLDAWTRVDTNRVRRVNQGDRRIDCEVEVRR